MMVTLRLAALLVCASVTTALAQTNDDRGGFTVRELGLSTGYTLVQLPPITLGGELPSSILEADSITSATATIDWVRVTPRTRYALEMFGTYTARGRYTQLNAPSGNLTFDVSRGFGRRWRLGASALSLIASADQLASQPTQVRRLVDDAASFEELAGRVAVARSPSPNPANAALFLPVNQSLDAADVYLNRSMVSSVRGEANYVHSVRLASYFRGSYTSTREISWRDSSARGPVLPVSKAQNAGMGVRYDRSDRTQITADVTGSQTSGLSADNVVTASVGYGWFGRKWLTQTTVGAAFRPFEIPIAASMSTSPPSRAPTVVFSGAIGYKFRAQTALLRYTRAPHDDYGHGGRNMITGFQGDVQSLMGSWSWSAPGSGWTAYSDVTIVRRPGNFSYILAGLSTVSVGRRLGPNLQVIGELLFDRHGSRMFEGFSMMREGARVHLVWTPSRRQTVEERSEQ